mmetsp:Transcript_50285/g.98576  ORF Transcript_50285/g.98576 Transcript_50285/m.98576 type:complete len:125 (+) Transcript_50285:703-1077(+)
MKRRVEIKQRVTSQKTDPIEERIGETEAPDEMTEAEIEKEIEIDETEIGETIGTETEAEETETGTEIETGGTVTGETGIAAKHCPVCPYNEWNAMHLNFLCHLTSLFAGVFEKESHGKYNHSRV